MKNLTSLQPRYLHYSLRTEEVYVYWVRFLIRFHRLRRHAEIGAEEVEQRGRLGKPKAPPNVFGVAMPLTALLRLPENPSTHGELSA